MADITLNSAVRSNLRTLQSTSDLLQQTEKRISTGKKVTSALDNPSSFFTSQALDRRAGDLNNLLDSVSNSVKTLEAADNGIKAITKVVESLKATARSALQSPKGVEASVTGTGGVAANVTASTFTVNGKTVTTTAGESLSDIADAINGLDGANVSAAIDGGQIKLTSDADIVIATGSGAVTGTGLTAATTAATITDQDAYDKRQGYVKDYNDALAQISSLAKDASYNGVNLLQGDDLDITFNEDGSSKLDVKGTNFDFGGLGLAELTEGVPGASNATTTDGAFDNKASINAVIDSLDSVFSNLEAQSSKFGSQLQIVQTRQSFTKDMIGTLEDGSAALTDADTNEEAANLATLQTRQSLIVSSLSISTSSEQNILQLLR